MKYQSHGMVNKNHENSHALLLFVLPLLALLDLSAF
nr:MAG TPA_asm: hypothetical protein [Caudoviricetes sp.]